MSKLGTRLGILRELGEFLRSNKKLWLTPVVVLLVLIGVLVVAAETSAVAPFIYTLF